MFQRLLIVLEEIKAGNTFKNLELHEIRQIIYSLYQAKLITKKYNELNKVV